MQEVGSPIKQRDPYSVRNVNLQRYSRPEEQPYHNRQQTNFRNVASIEIKELADSLAYAEFLLAKSLREKEHLVQENTAH